MTVCGVLKKLHIKKIFESKSCENQIAERGFTGDNKKFLITKI